MADPIWNIVNELLTGGMGGPNANTSTSAPAAHQGGGMHPPGRLANFSPNQFAQGLGLEPSAVTAPLSATEGGLLAKILGSGKIRELPGRTVGGAILEHAGTDDTLMRAEPYMKIDAMAMESGLRRKGLNALADRVNRIRSELLQHHLMNTGGTDEHLATLRKWMETADDAKRALKSNLGLAK